MLKPDQDFAHFRIVKLLGEGGMGQVYLAEDKKLQRQVALKILTAEYFGDSERLERFHREAKTAAQISHPNVMAIYDMGSTEDPTAGRHIDYIVMEYIKGKSLAEYLRQRSSDLTVVVRLAEKIAAGLAAAHKINVVHRDIKADNILVDDEEQPKILDFGLAKPLDPVQFSGDSKTKTVSRELTRAGKIVGTVAYMSPEQVRGETVDTRSDIFSFGVLLYRMATSEFPFPGNTEVSTLAKILETKHESPRIKNDAIPVELERIIDKCLQKDANDRYQDTRDLVVDLRNLRRQFDSGISDTVSGVTQEIKAVGSRPLYQRRWVWVVLVLAALFIVIEKFADAISGFVEGFKAGSKASVVSHGVKAAENSLAILEFENKTGDKTLDWLETGLPEILLTDLAQSQSLNLISRQRVLDAIESDRGESATVPSHEEFVEKALALGASRVLTGSFYKMADKIRIDARLEETSSGKILLGEKVVGADPFTIVDSLSGKIALAMNIVRSAGEQGIASVTSSSTDAYREYHLGMTAFGKELYDEAILRFSKAITMDSSFALPYMRVGMIRAFQSRSKEASNSIAKALQFEHRLPLKDRNMLDVYADIWLRRKFGDAMTKMKLMVSNYPDDQESRTIYGVLLAQLGQDTVGAFAQLDTVLAQNPSFQLALSMGVQLHYGFGDYTRATQIINRLKQFHPDSPAAYRFQAKIYTKTGKIQEAIVEYKELLKRFPSETDLLISLARLAVRTRDFTLAREFVEKFGNEAGKDLYERSDYLLELANLAQWAGRFETALTYLRQNLDLSRETNDSLQQTQAYDVLATTFESYDASDSALKYVALAEESSPTGLYARSPMMQVEIDPSCADKARPLLKKFLTNFKSRIPSEMWNVPDALERIFEGYAHSDTVVIIEALRSLIKSQSEHFGENTRELGNLLAAHGQFKEGKEILERYVSGEFESTSGFSYCICCYYLGRANEGLGNKNEAIKNYTEMLKYWGKPEIELKEITDARERLAKLTS